MVLFQLNGKNTQGENIADNGGVHESFRAYKKSVDSLGPEPALPGLTQFTPEQMFFVSFSQVWCEIATPESLLGQVGIAGYLQLPLFTAFSCPGSWRSPFSRKVSSVGSSI